MEENEKADALSKIIDIDDCGISFAFFISVVVQIKSIQAV
jgi:hypothetical protein